MTGEPDADLVAGLESYYASAAPTETRAMVGSQTAIGSAAVFSSAARRQPIYWSRDCARLVYLHAIALGE